MKKHHTRLGRKIRGLRLKLDFTVRDVERTTIKSGYRVPNAYLSQIELGQIKFPHPHVLRSLARTYGVDFLDLMVVAGYITKKDLNESARNIAF